VDNISPLFAIEAEKLLLSGSTNEAIELCRAGIAEYPDYQSAYYILSKCYIDINNYVEALSVLSDAIQLFPNNRMLFELFNTLNQNNLTSIDNDSLINLNEFVDIAVDTNNIGDTSALPSTADNSEITTDDTITDELIIDKIKIDDTIIDTEEQFVSEKPDYSNNPFLKLFISNSIAKQEDLNFSDPALIPGLECSPLAIVKTTSKRENFILEPVFPDYPEFERIGFRDVSSNFTNKDSLNNDDPFAALANIIENVKIKPKTSDSEIQTLASTTNDFQPKEKVISETIAQIYVKQKAYAEAIDAYKALMEAHPDKKSYYSKIIKELKTKI